MKEQVESNNLWVAYIKYLFVAYLLSFLLLGGISWCLYKINISLKAVSVCLVVTYIISNFFAGWRMGKKAEKRQFVWGLLVGLGYSVIVILVSFVGNGYMVASMEKQILVFSLCSLSGMFGGMLS